MESPDVGLLKVSLPVVVNKAGAVPSLPRSKKTSRLPVLWPGDVSICHWQEKLLCVHGWRSKQVACVNAFDPHDDPWREIIGHSNMTSAAKSISCRPSFASNKRLLTFARGPLKKSFPKRCTSYALSVDHP